MGTYEGAPYLVSELLEGATLREQVARGPLSVRKVIDYGAQIARGLSAAHEKGIIHRDLKPENLFVTKDDQIKILDFGLAKLTQPQSTSPETASTETFGTQPGAVLGTVNYMSPEQVRGEWIDQRTDIFAFGIILYELLTGKRAFQKPSSPETMTAILNEDPADISQFAPNIPVVLQRIVQRSLEKKPGQRFQSAQDLGFALEAISDAPTQSIPIPRASRKLRSLWRALVVGLFALIAATAIFLGVGKRWSPQLQPAFKQLTFRRGRISAARFTLEKDSVMYSAEWDGGPVQIFSTNLGSPGSMNMGFPEKTDLLAVSATDELALSVNEVRDSIFVYRGILARSPSKGGAPREVLDNVQYADWLPDGKGLAAVRPKPQYSLEFPLGNTVYKTSGWISHVRVSPDGQSAAFVDHPVYGDDRGRIALVDRGGHKKDLTGVFFSAWGTAWSPDGREVWFAASETGSNRALRAVTISRKERVLLAIPGCLTLLDVSRSGRVLVSRQTERAEMAGLLSGNASESNLSWFDSSNLADLSSDGRTIAFGEYGEAGGGRYLAFLRAAEASYAVQLGEGVPQALSPDRKWLLTLNTFDAPARLFLLPTGAGEVKTISTPSIAVESADWLPDGKQIVVWGSESSQPVRGYLYDLTGKSLRELTPSGYSAFDGRPISLDGKWIAMRDDERRALLFPVKGGSSRLLPAVANDDAIAGWSENGRSIYIYQPSAPVHVFRVNIVTGARELWKVIAPSDTAGTQTIENLLVTPDGRSYVYSYSRFLSELFVVNGVK
jgi:Tol biopolymer transport system component